MGGTYAVGVMASLYANPQEHFQVHISFDAAPERADTLIGLLFRHLDSVRTSGGSAEELARIATIQRWAVETALLDNRYWIRTIQQYDRLGIPLDRIVRPV